MATSHTFKTRGEFSTHLSRMFKLESIPLQINKTFLECKN